MTFGELRSLALALPQVEEQPHFDYVSFRYKGRILATVPPELTHAHVFLEEDAIDAAAGRPGAEVREWGRTRYLRVTLAEVDTSDMVGWLRAAWRRRAPKRVWTVVNR